MVDFEIMDKALKIAWIQRIAEPSEAVWKLIPEYATIHYCGFILFVPVYFTAIHVL